MLNDREKLMPGIRELLGIIETSNNEVTKFYKCKKLNGNYYIQILQMSENEYVGVDSITIEEEHFNDFVDSLINVLETIQTHIQNELN
jgi:hypothetical protein